MSSRATSAAVRLDPPRIPETDAAWIAAMNAPFDDTPDTEQERADLAEAQASPGFTSGVEVRRSLASRKSP